ncbi:MAG: hypothetical protein U0559_18665 [Anaerolineae bacterium]
MSRSRDSSLSPRLVIALVFMFVFPPVARESRRREVAGAVLVGATPSLVWTLT